MEAGRTSPPPCERENETVAAPLPASIRLPCGSLTTPAITVLMPVRAYYPRYLREALDSLLAQTSEAWRLLVIAEPGHREELGQVIAPYLQDARCELIVSEGRKLAGSYNTGMRRARTEFVGILMGDDLWAPDAVAVLTREIRAHPEVDFFHSSRRIIGESGEPLSSVYMSRSEVRLEDFGLPSPVKHLLCWRRSLALSFGGMDESLNSVGPDDLDFPWSMAEHGAVFHAIPECLYVYRDHRSSFRLTTHLPLSVHKREIGRIMRKHGVDSAVIEQAVRKAGRSHLRQCRYRSKVDRWLKARLRVGRASAWRETYR
jgi:glycosyltransferase involved in cell wall biosynthesis